MTAQVPAGGFESLEEFSDWCEEHGFDTVIPGTSDTNGAWIGKRVPLIDFVRMAGGEGVPYCNVLFAITRDGNENVFAPEGLETYFPTHRNGCGHLLPGRIFRAFACCPGIGTL